MNHLSLAFVKIAVQNLDLFPKAINIQRSIYIRTKIIQRNNLGKMADEFTGSEPF